MTECEDIPVLLCLQAAGNHVITRRVRYRLASRRIISVLSFYFSKHSGCDIGWLNQLRGVIDFYLFKTLSQIDSSELKSPLDPMLLKMCGRVFIALSGVPLDLASPPATGVYTDLTLLRLLKFCLSRFARSRR